MQENMTAQELELLRLRIAASPETARPALQQQLETLIRSLALREDRTATPQKEHDADVEALFDNLPV